MSVEKVEDKKILILMSKSYLDYPHECFKVREPDWKNLEGTYTNADYAIRTN